jgi:hypothetical protein
VLRIERSDRCAKRIARGTRGGRRALRRNNSVRTVPIGVRSGPTKSTRQRQAFQRYAALRTSRLGAAPAGKRGDNVDATFDEPGTNARSHLARRDYRSV